MKRYKSFGCVPHFWHCAGHFSESFSAIPNNGTHPLFLNWFKQLANYGKIDPEEYGSLEAAIQSKEEIKSMLLTALERQKEQLRDEVRSEVRDEVRSEHALQIARNMLTQNFSPVQVADLLGLPLEQVQQLQDEIDAATAL